ncbi:protein of unknown function [Blastococcus saxobsidens DD2]|uniref:Uncharacterized protein n=1 Tax=Blastococcus saxobsidens (strain DD2) TaxID=1146883 RepID=H6RT43_BLASD|nr:protein of unknown function [Blastococcus saxobsidens DD2]
MVLFRNLGEEIPTVAARSSRTQRRLLSGDDNPRCTRLMGHSRNGANGLLAAATVDRSPCS